jgi:hypothetical protein
MRIVLLLHHNISINEIVLITINCKYWQFVNTDKKKNTVSNNTNINTSRVLHVIRILILFRNQQKLNKIITIMQSKKLYLKNIIFFLFWNVLLIKWNVFYYNHSFDT